jgi:hypothetical protein
MKARRMLRWVLISALAFGSVGATACEGEETPIEVDDGEGDED